MSALLAPAVTDGGAASESIRRTLDALHAERVQTMEAEAFRIYVEQRHELTTQSDRSGFVKVGDRVPRFVLPEVDGGTVDIEVLLENGSIVLVFFRFAGCPVCNLTLPYYQRQLLPALRELGIALIAVSPQIPAALVEIKRRHALQFPVVSDVGNAVGRQLGILFTANAATQQQALAKGTDYRQITGTDTWELPMPTTLIVDRQGIVRFVDVQPDWMVRTEASDIIAAARGIGQS
ncbi:MAG: peroxiredoxin-like family protein [Solimonas sp.]